MISLIYFIYLIIMIENVHGQLLYEGKPVKFLIDQQTGREINEDTTFLRSPYSPSLSGELLNELKKAEEIVPGHIENTDGDVMITSTTRYNSSEKSHPWVAVIQRNGVHFCTGSILNRHWVITAAHCFESANPQNDTILLGTTSRDDGNEYKVSKIISHQRYDACNHKSSDIALIKINGSIDLSEGIKPIDLPSKHADGPQPGEHLVISGWGKVEINRVDTEKYLGEIWLTVIPIELCSRGYRKLGEQGHTIFRSQICTWNLNQRVCEGNSGGPAVLYRDNKPILMGTVSFGVRCLDTYPLVFSKISYFLRWISEMMANN